MADFVELNLDELENVVGGATKKVQTNTSQNAAVKDAPGNGKVIDSLKNGTEVNTLGAAVYDAATGRHWVRIEYKNARGRMKNGWIAASIVGMKR